MILQAKKRAGDNSNSRNIIDTRIVRDGSAVLHVTHSIEVLEGSVVHGGGAAAGEFLHYKSHDVDVDTDGIIDYSNTTIHTSMQQMGTAKIRVLAEVTNEDDLKATQEAWVVWKEQHDAHELHLKGTHGPEGETVTQDEVPFQTPGLTEQGMQDWRIENPIPKYTPAILSTGIIDLEWLAESDSDWI